MAHRFPTAAILRRLSCAVALTALAACATQPARVSEKTDPADSMTQLGQQMLAQGKPEAALQLFRRAKLSPAAQIGMGDAFRSLGQYQDAAAAYAAAGYSHKGAALGAGGVAIALGHPDQAMTIYETALKALPQDGELLGGMALVHEAQGDHAAALDLFRAALKADPASRKLHNNYGLSLAIGGDYAASYGELEALARDPQSTQRERQTLALAYALGNRFDAAERVASIDLGSPDVQVNLTHYRELQALPTGARIAAIMGASATPSPSPAMVASAPAAPAVEAQAEPLKFDALQAMISAKPIHAEMLAEPAPVKNAVPALAEQAQPAMAAAAPAPAGRMQPIVEPDRPAQAKSVQPAKANLPAAPGTGWGVQLAAFRTAGELPESWRKLNRKYAGLLAKLSPHQGMIDLGAPAAQQDAKQASGVYYRLIAATLPGKAEAQALCGQLQAQGQNCIVRGPADMQIAALAPAPKAGSAEIAATTTKSPAPAAPKPARAAKAEDGPAVKWTLVGSTGASAPAANASAGNASTDWKPASQYPGEGQAP